MTKADENLELAQFLPYLLSVLSGRASRGLADAYERQFGISIPEWRILAHLSQNDCVSETELVQRTEMHKSKVSRAASRLAEAGIVAKSVDVSDRRIVVVSMTRKGRRLFQQIIPHAYQFEAHMLDVLTIEEEKILRQIVPKLIEGLVTSR
ncbi:MarR family winged helix-turn-helix transcriptional regulator [Devosia sp. A369]